ncbi:AIPR family protein [Bacillus andreraoultii]|uniref:AIPR family protein n=1 Tax=Bacillus andreraoultii TaxID=1499685 RepID=UPI00053A0B81|nr:AIPR family protein [Bacillus andreraoultii]
MTLTKEVKSQRNYEKVLAQRIEQSIEEYIKENKKNESKVEVGNLFCEWVLYNIFELREDEVLNAVEVSGRFDNGIDAIFDYNGEICVIQTKYNNSHNIDAIQRFISDCKRLANEAPDSDRATVQELMAKVREAYQKHETINCYYVTNNSIIDWHKTNIKSELSTLGDDFNSLKFEFIDFDGILEKFQIKDGQLPREIRDATIPITIQENFEKFDTTVAMVRLRDFANFVNKGGNPLFHSNIRSHIKGSRINRGIKHTLENEPEKFWFYNNGITIVCYDFWQKSGQLFVQAPQIVNGCQTAKTIGDFFKTKTVKEVEQLEKEGYLLIKVIRTRKNVSDKDKKALRDNITRYTNSQNAVKGMDFYALDEFQQQLKQRFKQLSYFYEIQRGSFIAKSPAEKASYIGDERYNYLLDNVKNKNKFVLPAKEVIQSYTAGIIQWPHIAYGKANELTPNGAKWQDIMNDDTKNLPLEHFLFPYLVLKYAKETLKYKAGPNDFRKNSAFLFVSTYYLFLLSLYNQVNNSEYESPIDIDISIYISIFSNKDMNQRIMHNIHEILKSFFRDSQVKSEIGDNLRGFLQNKVHRPKNWNVLNQKVEQQIEDLEMSIEEEEIELLKDLSQLMN